MTIKIGTAIAVPIILMPIKTTCYASGMYGLKCQVLKKRTPFCKIRKRLPTHIQTERRTLDGK